jgi:hypothetical protein
MSDDMVARPEFGGGNTPPNPSEITLTTAVLDLSKPIWMKLPKFGSTLEVLIKPTTGHRFKEWGMRFRICQACGGLGLVSDDEGRKYECPKCRGKSEITWGDSKVRVALMEEIVHGWRGFWVKNYGSQTELTEVAYSPEMRVNFAGVADFFDECLAKSLEAGGRVVEEEAKN